MFINKVFVNYPMEENCYVLSDSTREAVIIDCGCFSKADFQPIVDYINSESLNPVHLLCTHFHFDHIMGLPYVKETYNLLPEGSALEEKMYKIVPQQVKLFLGTNALEFNQLPFGRQLEHDNQVSFGHHVLQVIHTPGHSEGGLCFYCKEENALWSGDTLFRQSIGRTDLPGGDFKQLIENIRTHLWALPDDTKVYPGHGPATTIGYEKAYNPYLIY